MSLPANHASREWRAIDEKMLVNLSVARYSTFTIQWDVCIPLT
jgi:hypothetical protein